MHALGGAALLTTNATALTSGIGSAGEGRPTTVGFLPWRAYDVFHTVQHERLADLDGFVACKPGILTPGLHAMRVFC